jgi:DNA-binding beta-propeller fold protein YncE
MGVAIDSAGNVLVADTLNHRILKFDSKGKLLRKMDSFGERNGELATPVALATDRAGNLFVGEYLNYRIQKFDSSWRFVAKSAGSGDSGPAFELVSGIAVDSKGAVFVADPRTRCIVKLDNSLNFLQKWSSSLSVPEDVELDGEGNLIVLDCEECKVKKFDAKFGFITEWGSAGSGEGEFKGPGGIAVDSEGNVYVADTDNHRIQKFDSSGKFLLKWGREGSGEGELKEPTGMAVDSQGNIYVCDAGNNRIQKFSPGGKKAVTSRTKPPRSEEVKPAKAKRLTVENVVLMKELGLDDGTILQKLSDTGTSFSAQEIEQLKEAGFGDEFLSKIEKPAQPAKKPKLTAEKGLAGSWHLKSAGLTVDLALEGDGTFSWHYVGPDETEDLKGAWKKVDDSTIEVQEEGEATKSLMPCKLIDANTLQITVAGVILQFNREK